MGTGTLIVRADASGVMGYGHAMRCLALAQAWQDQDGVCIFLMAQSTPMVAERLRAEGIDVLALEERPGSAEDAARLVEIARSRRANWVVLDGYHFDSEYHRRLKTAGTKLLVLDDHGHTGAYDADLVLDQNVCAGEELYQRRGPKTKLLLGTAYALLRREFRKWREWKREIAPVGRRVVVSLGGGDGDNVTDRVVRGLRAVTIQGLEVRVVAAGSERQAEALKELVASFAGTVSVEQNVPNMAELMAWADVAVSGAGTTCWELCLLGLPAILIDMAENQRPAAQALEQKGVAIHIGSGEKAIAEEAAKLERLLLSPDTRSAMSRRGRELVDGRGAERVVAAMRCAGMWLRRVEAGDCRLLWEWTNDPAVRMNSFSSEPVAWERHLEWFRAKLADPKAVLYLATDGEDRPVGLVRYDLRGTRAFISISLEPKLRGKGYGSILLARGVEELFRETSSATVDAYVRPGNEPSLRLFARAGFRKEKTATIEGQPAVHLVLEKRRV